MSLSTQHLLTTYIEQYALDAHLNADLLGSLRVYQFEAGKEVYTAKDELEHLYFMVDGKAQVSYYLANGKRSIIAMISPFSVIGDIELFEDKTLQLDVITIENSIFLGIKKADVVQYGYHDPQFLRFIIQHLSRKLRGSGYNQLSYDLPLINRLANYLLIQPIKENAIIPESKTLIADLLGTSPRHLNRVIKNLEDEGIISWQKNQIRIRDIEKLRSYGEL